MLGYVLAVLACIAVPVELVWMFSSIEPDTATLDELMSPRR
jgi:hypothetical protein